jgi:hypothetical protein
MPNETDDLALQIRLLNETAEQLINGIYQLSQDVQNLYNVLGAIKDPGSVLPRGDPVAKSLIGQCEQQEEKGGS